MTSNFVRSQHSIKVDVLLPDTSLYEVLHHFSRKLFEAFRRAGCMTRLLEGQDRYVIPLQSPPDFTLAFNGALKIEDDQLFCDYIKIPHIACLVDPPYRFMELVNSSHMLITCDDEYCCKDFKKNFFPNTFFMPQAVEKELAMEGDVEKKYDIVMLSTYIDCEKRKEEWNKKFPLYVCQAMHQAITLTLNDEKTSFIFALKQALGEEYCSKLKISLLTTILSDVELYIKGRDKIDLLHSIKGHEVHVFGDSIDTKQWKDEFQNSPNITAHPPVSFMEALEIMKRSKIILNSSIKNKKGAHERIFSGSAVGAIVVTNDNSYIRQHFEDGKDVLLYRRSAWDDINNRIHNLLNNETLRIEMSQQARAKILASHTWDHRVAQLLADIINASC